MQKSGIYVLTNSLGDFVACLSMKDTAKYFFLKKKKKRKTLCWKRVRESFESSLLLIYWMRNGG